MLMNFGKKLHKRPIFTTNLRYFHFLGFKFYEVVTSA